VEVGAGHLLEGLGVGQDAKALGQVLVELLIDGLLVGIVLVVGRRAVRDVVIPEAGDEDGLLVGGGGRKRVGSWDDTILLGGGGGGRGFPSPRANELLVVYLTASGGFGRLGSSFGARGR